MIEHTQSDFFDCQSRPLLYCLSSFSSSCQQVGQFYGNIPRFIESTQRCTIAWSNLAPSQGIFALYVQELLNVKVFHTGATRLAWQWELWRARWYWRCYWINTILQRAGVICRWHLLFCVPDDNCCQKNRTISETLMLDWMNVSSIAAYEVQVSPRIRCVSASRAVLPLFISTKCMSFACVSKLCCKLTSDGFGLWLLCCVQRNIEPTLVLRLVQWMVL